MHQKKPEGRLGEHEYVAATVAISQVPEGKRISPDVATLGGKSESPAGVSELAPAILRVPRLQPYVKEHDMTPDWEDFGRRILERFCEGDSQIEMLDVQEWGEATGVLIEKIGGFDPDEDIDVTGASEAGDPFYLVAPRQSS